MPQGALPYKYEEEKHSAGLTALAGLPVYLDLASVLGLGDRIRSHMHVKIRGWTDEQVVTSVVLLNLAGGDAVDDMRILARDEGFSTVLGRVETKGLTRHQRRVQEDGAPCVSPFPVRRIPVPRRLPRPRGREDPREGDRLHPRPERAP